MAHPEEHPDDSDLPDAGRSKLKACRAHFFAQQFTGPMAEFVVGSGNKQDREFTSSVIGSLMTLGELFCVIGILVVMHMELVTRRLRGRECRRRP